MHRIETTQDSAFLTTGARFGVIAVLLMIAVLFVCMLTTGGCAPEKQGVVLLHNEDKRLLECAFLAGSWVAERGGQVMEEHWTPARGGSMLGVGRTIVDDETVFCESLRIELRVAGLVYIATPDGQETTEFVRKNSPSAPQMLVFENPQHDYPTRIAYWLDEEGRLHARIEGKRGGKSTVSEWVFRRGQVVVRE